ncbi:hypothetical protein FB446DRAFT_717675 [Lentinula raphanica]|nr:hypothetical protein FB446DRAFT_717675 [Lentinula raphanica]
MFQNSISSLKRILMSHLTTNPTNSSITLVGNLTIIRRHAHFDDEEFGLDFEEHHHHLDLELRPEDGAEDPAIDVELDEHLVPNDHRFSDEPEDVEYHPLPHVHKREHKQPVEVISVPVSVPVEHQIRSLERRSPESPRPETEVDNSLPLLPRSGYSTNGESARSLNSRLASLQRTESVAWQKQIISAKGDAPKTNFYQRVKRYDDPKLLELAEQTMGRYYTRYIQQVTDASSSQSSSTLPSMQRRQLDSPRQGSTVPAHGAQVPAHGAQVPSNGAAFSSDPTGRSLSSGQPPLVSAGTTADTKHVGAPSAPIHRSVPFGPFGGDLD